MFRGNLNPTGRDYTYFSPPRSTYSRIDYFFAFKREQFRIPSCDNGTIDMSDHAPIIMRVNIGNNPKSTSWKLNSSLLNNPQVKGELEKVIDTYFKENNNGEVSPPMVWDAFKAVLRGKVISISSSLKKRRQERLNSLYTKLRELQKDHKARPGTDELSIKKLQKEIDEILTEEVKKKLVFLKQGYYEAGSKAMTLLSYKLRKQQADTTIN